MVLRSASVNDPKAVLVMARARLSGSMGYAERMRPPSSAARLLVAQSPASITPQSPPTWCIRSCRTSRAFACNFCRSLGDVDLPYCPTRQSERVSPSLELPLKAGCTCNLAPRREAVSKGRKVLRAKHLGTAAQRWEAKNRKRMAFTGARAQPLAKPVDFGPGGPSACPCTVGAA